MQKVNTARLSIIIPTCNRLQSLSRLLHSLAQSVSGIDTQIEIVITDDGSIDPVTSAAVPATLCSYTTILRHEQSHGPAAARNYAIRTSSAPWLAFLDDDVTVSATWIPTALAIIADTPHSTAGIEGQTRSRGRGIFDIQVENTAGGRYLTSCILYRRSILLQTGCFDERFRGPFCEDQELACRVLRFGPIIFAPQLVVTHEKRAMPFWRSIARAPVSICRQLHSELRFFMKHRDTYHRFRHASNFWGTWYQHAVKNIFKVRHYPLRNLIACPRQTLLFVLVQCVEQCCALVLGMHFVRLFLKMQRTIFSNRYDWQKTAAYWNVESRSVTDHLSVSWSLRRAFCFSRKRISPLQTLSTLHALSSHTNQNQLKIILRIDDLNPEHSADTDIFLAALQQMMVPLCVGVISPHWPDHTALLHQLKSFSCEPAFHGFSHRGHCGPYQSELMQISHTRMEEKLASCLDNLPKDLIPYICIPPFNAVHCDQFDILAKRFNIIATGPETCRFMGYYIGPLFTTAGTCIIPALPPLYATSQHLRQPGLLRSLLSLKGTVCVSMHMDHELSDNFESMQHLISHLRPHIIGWNSLCAQ
jgi:glycosyltransferase involved in cell wall biosynthesis